MRCNMLLQPQLNILSAPKQSSSTWNTTDRWKLKRGFGMLIFDRTGSPAQDLSEIIDREKLFERHVSSSPDHMNSNGRVRMGPRQRRRLTPCSCWFSHKAGSIHTRGCALSLPRSPPHAANWIPAPSMPVALCHQAIARMDILSSVAVSSAYNCPRCRT